VPGSIICGLDDSESAKGAARVARELSARLGMRLVFVHVVDAESPDETTTALVQRLHSLAERAMELDCGADWLVDAGHPSDRLLAKAAAEKASLIGHRLARSTYSAARQHLCPGFPSGILSSRCRAAWRGCESGQ
jgi:nucleotide-binding universal stress UspA family protein